jgi:hypothetical protein
MMVKERKCFLVEMYWNARFTCKCFQFKYLKSNLNNFFGVDFGKKFKIISFGYNMKNILIIKFSF